jgi:DNA replication protein DnaC
VQLSAVELELQPEAGKTHLAVAAMRLLIKRGFHGPFVNARTFVRCQTAFKQKESAREIVDEILHRDFLILDDLGSEKATDYVRQSLLYLVDECYSREVALVATSNFGLEALNQLDKRIASRLVEMCDLIKFDETDDRAQISRNRLNGASRITTADLRAMWSNDEQGTKEVQPQDRRPN